MISKSAVHKIFQFRERLFTVFRYINVHKMSADWQTEKDKYLSMDHNEKRDLYKKYTILEDVPTWRKYSSGKSLAAKINVISNNQIDNSKNAVLADKISVFCGDITTLEIDAIVNAANSTLLGGGGVDGAIHRAAGPNLVKECSTLGGCPTGEAKITGGYRLPAKYVIHTVGPRGENGEDLKRCYNNSLSIILKNNLRSVAFPCISTGIYGYPNESAAHVAAYTVRKFLESHTDSLDRVIFCLFLEIDIKIYEGILQSYFPLK